MFNKKENEKLRIRVHELEEILCPYEQHDYIEVGRKLETDCTCGIVDCYYKIKYICKRCKKTIIKDDRFQ